MKFRIFTLPFREEVQGFDDHLVQEFCKNKKVHEMRSEFFSKGNEHYWSVCVYYEVLLEDKGRKIGELDEKQQLLYEHLREWRKNRAEKEGFPPFLICKNSQLVEIVLYKCNTYEKLKSIKGIGAAKVNKYGQDIINIIDAFYGQGKTKQ